jgi:hypothetical protein
MAENRCPMCSKVNPAENEVCEFCGARLTPLVIDSSSGGESLQSEDPAPEASEEGVPDWLSRIRSQGVDDEEAQEEDESADEPVEEAPSGDEPEWLDRLREATVEEKGPPEEELPDWVSEIPVEESPRPESTGTEPPEVPAEEQLPPDFPVDEAVPDAEASTPDWLLRIREKAAESTEAEGEIPLDIEEEDWLSRLQEQDEVEASEAAPEPASGTAPSKVPPELPTEPPVDSVEEREDPDQETPDGESDQEAFIESDSGVFRFPEAPVTGQGWVEVSEEPTEDSTEEEESAPEAPEDEAIVDEVGIERGLDSVAAEIKAQVEPSEPPQEEGLPSWLEELQEHEVEEEPPIEDDGVPQPTPGLEEPIAEEITPAEAELPHVPALVVEGKPADISDVDAFDLDAAEVEVPDWFDEMKKDEGEAEEEEKPDLAPATLPAWLEAMRPVDTFRSGVEITPEEDQSVESAGPLAGLRGVLIAEPIVAMPRTPSIGSTQLDISERQYAQAEMLQRMVKQEERESVSAPSFQPRLTLLRILIGALLVAAVLLPILFGFPAFSLPTLEPIELGVLSSTVEALPLDQPVLLVFDYDPGYSAEMEAVAGAFIEQITNRSLPVATMSTRPSGSQLALALMEKYGSRHGYIPGEDLIHLGYLSGGPLAVQLFAASPRDAILQGFAIPPALEDSPGGAWDAPMLQEVDQLSDFGMVAVITSGTDNARNWAEQAKPYMYVEGVDVTPLVMVISAGAEPLLRPYYEASDPRINGLLSGLPAAAAYELRNGVPGDAQARWNPFGAGILLAEIVLIVGIAYGILLWFLRRNRAKRS